MWARLTSIAGNALVVVAAWVAAGCTAAPVRPSAPAPPSGPQSAAEGETASRDWLVPEDTLLDDWARRVAARLPRPELSAEEARADITGESGFVELHQQEYRAATDDAEARTALTGLAWHALQRGQARMAVAHELIADRADPSEELELAAADLQWQVTAGLAHSSDVATVARVWLLAAIYRTSARGESMLPARRAIRVFNGLIDEPDGDTPRPVWLHERGMAHHLLAIALRRRGLDATREFRLAVFDQSDALEIWPAHHGFRLARASAALGLGESLIADRRDGLNALDLAVADANTLLQRIERGRSASPVVILARLIRAESFLHAGTFVKGLRARERRGSVSLPDGFPDDATARLQAAATDYLVVSQLDPECSDAGLGLGRCLMRLRRLDEAIVVLDSTLRIDPGNPRVVIARRIAGIMADQRTPATATESGSRRGAGR